MSKFVSDEFEKVTTWKPGMSWEVAIQELYRRREIARQMGGTERVERHHQQGKLTIRERIERLVDKDTFFEAGSLMGKGKYDKNFDLVGFTPAAYVQGFAQIDGRTVAVGGNDFTISGGSPAGIEKHSNWFMQPMAYQYNIPLVQFSDGAGASAANYEEEGRMALNPGSLWWYDVQLLKRVPMVSAVVGSTAGHVAGRTIFSHFSVMVKGIGQIFPAGPPVVARALGENIQKDDLGGARMHARETGVIDNEAEDEDDCCRQIRDFLSYMPDNVWQAPGRVDLGDDPNRRLDDIMSIVPIDRKKPYNMYKVIERLADKGKYFEMRRFYGRAIITAFARMDGYVVGILASNPNFLGGALDGKASQKMARFADICTLFNIPVVVLSDVPGFMIGSESEKEGTMRYGMLALMAAQEATVPKVQISLRKNYGVGGDAMCSFDCYIALDLKLGWPSGEWGAIPVEGGVAAAYRREIESAADPEAKRRELEGKLVGVRSPFRAAEAGDCIDIIDPRDSRAIICRFIKAMQPTLKRHAEVAEKRSVRP
ncbi:MAG: carboxyl transferase domain-containing protein [Dehalococcoidales bacterium]|nr:carboxyl transferase domain-containing protein [Dehalococcoidales bacterium]